MGLSLQPTRRMSGKIATLIAVFALIAQPMYGLVAHHVANAATDYVSTESADTSAPQVQFINAPQFVNSADHKFQLTATDVKSGVANWRMIFLNEAGNNIGIGSVPCSPQTQGNSATATCYADANLGKFESGETYTARAYAKDKEGNEGSADHKFTVDTSLPQVKFAGVPATINPTSYKFNLTATDTISGVNRWQVVFIDENDKDIRIGRVPCTPQTLGSSATATCFVDADFSKFVSGKTYKARAIVTDKAGNIGDYVEQGFTADTVSPTIDRFEFQNASAGVYNPTKVVARAVDGDGAGVTNVYINVYKKDANGDWKQQGGTYEQGNPNGRDFAEMNASYALIKGDGTYMLQSWAKDAVGNIGEKRFSHEFVVDSIAPVVTIDSPAAGSTVKGGTDIKATIVDENLSHYYLLVKVRADSSQPWTELYKKTDTSEGFASKVLYTLPSDVSGEVYVQLEAKDKASNKDDVDSVKKIFFTLDNSAPKITSLELSKLIGLNGVYSTSASLNGGVLDVTFTTDEPLRLTGSQVGMNIPGLPGIPATGWTPAKLIDASTNKYRASISLINRTDNRTDNYVDSFFNDKHFENVKLYIRTVDNLGNTDSVYYYSNGDFGKSPSSAYTFTLDNVAPTTSIDVNVQDGKVTVSGKATDNTALNRVTLQLKNMDNGQRLGGVKSFNLIPEGKEGDWSYVYDMKSLGYPEGNYDIAVQVVDRLNNRTKYDWQNGFEVKYEPVLSADYFTVHADHLGVGFSIDRFDDATKVEVELFDENEKLITKNVGDSDDMRDLLNATSGQISSPFYIPGKANDSFWTFGSADWKSVTPAYAVVTVFYGNDEPKIDQVDFVSTNQDNPSFTYAALIAKLSPAGSSDSNEKPVEEEVKVINSEQTSGRQSTPLTGTAGFAGGFTGFLNANTVIDDNTATDDATDTDEEGEVAAAITDGDENGEVKAAEDVKDSWSLINLLLTIAVAAASIFALIGLAGKKEDRNIGARLLTVVPALGAGAVLLFAEDFSGQMSWVNIWTLLVGALLVVQMIILANTKSQAE